MIDNPNDSSDAQSDAAVQALEAFQEHSNERKQLKELDLEPGNGTGLFNLQYDDANPYAECTATQEIIIPKINGRDEEGQMGHFRRRADRSRSKESSDQGRRSRTGRRAKERQVRQDKISPFDKMDQIRYACYEIDMKMQQMRNLIQSYPVMANESDMVEIPLGMWQELTSVTDELHNDFQAVQGQWMEQHDLQHSDYQRQRSKNRHYKKKLKAVENQSILYLRDQKEFEKSLQDITKEHDQNKNQMGLVLDQMESQVSQLKDTRLSLNMRYESQLEQAFKEMVNFYHNIEQEKANENSETDSMCLDRVFFIKPTEEMNIKLQKSASDNGVRGGQRGKSQLRISTRALSDERISARDQRNETRAKSSNHKTPDIPRLQIDKLQPDIQPDLKNPAIINQKLIQRSNRGSSRQYQKASQRQTSGVPSNISQDKPNTYDNSNQNEQIQPIRSSRGKNQMHSQKSNRQITDRNPCPSGRNDQQSAKQSKRGGQPSTRSHRSQQNQNKKINNKDNILKSTPKNDERPVQDETQDFITNPVMCGAMNLSSKFENNLEDDYDGANVTLDMKTDRLRQFPEVYDDLKRIKDPDERIILKQMVFMQYEKILKKQAKQEKKRRKKQLKEQQKQQAAEQQALSDQKDQKQIEIRAVDVEEQLRNPGGEGPQYNNDAQKESVLAYRNFGDKSVSKSLAPTPTNQSAYTNFKFNKINCSSRGSLHAGGNPHQLSSASSMQNLKQIQKGLGMNERYGDANDYTQPFSIQSELPPLKDTQEIRSAQHKFKLQDVNKSELINCEEELVIGLKSATCTSLIKKYEEEFRKKELLRAQIKETEQKINYSSSSQSRVSLLEKQVSQCSRVSRGINMLQEQVLSRQYASNQSNSNPILIADSDHSMISDQKFMPLMSNKNSKYSGGSIQGFNLNGKKNLEHVNLEVNLDQSTSNGNNGGSGDSHNTSVQHQHRNSGQKQLPTDSHRESLSNYNMSKMNDQSIISQRELNSNEKFGAQKINEMKQIDCLDRQNSQDLHLDQVDQSIVSSPSQYQRFLEQHDYQQSSPSPSQLQIQHSYYQNSNSYGQSDNSLKDQQQLQQYQMMQNYHPNPQNHDGQGNNPNYQHYQNYVDSGNGMGQSQQEEQDQNIVDRMNNEIKQIRQKLPLDVIHERQSEFSQSMITNAARINTNRSRQSKNNHYANGSMVLNKGNSGALPSVRSDINLSSKRQKSSRQGTGNLSSQGGITQNNTDNKPQLKQKSTSFSDIDDYKSQIIRCNSQQQAQTSRNKDINHQINQSLIYQNKHLIVGEQQQICIDGSQIQNSRNLKKKVSKSSKDENQSQNNQLQRRPSFGKIEQQNRQKILHGLENNTDSVPVANVNIPPSGKSRSNQFDKKDQISYQNVRNQYKASANNVNLTQQNNSQLNTEREYLIQNQQNYQPHSHRSHIGGGESLRDRSYFDESPAIFQNGLLDVIEGTNENLEGIDPMVLYPSAARSKGEKKGLEKEKNSPIESACNDKSLQSNMHTNTNYNYCDEEGDSMLQQKINSGIQHSSNLMQIHSSIPSASVPHSSRLSNQSNSRGSRFGEQQKIVTVSSKSSNQLHQMRMDQSLQSRTNNFQMTTNEQIDELPEIEDIQIGSIEAPDTQVSLRIQKDTKGDCNSKQELSSRSKKVTTSENDIQGKQSTSITAGKPFNMMGRSNSECQLRDKEFYEMCDDEDEIAMYCKFAEQNLFDAIHVRNLSQYKNNNIHNIHNQSSDNSAAQLFIQNANKSGSTINNNRLVFMSQRTLNQIIYDKGYQTQDKTQFAYQMGNGTNQIVDQNSSQQQTRSKAAFQRFQCDPTRLMASSNNLGGAASNGPHNQNINNYLGTNFLTNSLDDGTMHMQNQIMMPTHKYNRRTLHMMQNLHNNYLYSANSGILFTMQRGWNSGAGASSGAHGVTHGQSGIGQSFKNLTNIARIDKELLNKNESTSGVSGVMNGLNVPGAMMNMGQNGTNNNEKSGNIMSGALGSVRIDNTRGTHNVELNSLGGDPVNISNLIMGTKQQTTTDQINVGCITIIDGDGKFMIDRRHLIEGANSSHQTKARRLFSHSRVVNGQQTTSDFSNLQTKQLSILRNNYHSIQQFHMNTRNKNGEPNSAGQPNQRSVGAPTSEPFEDYKDDAINTSSQQHNSIIMRSDAIQGQNIPYRITQKDNAKSNSLDEKLKKLPASQQRPSPAPTNGKSDGSNRIMNLINGLKQIQQKQQSNMNQAPQTRSSSDLGGHINNSSEQLSKRQFQSAQASQAQKATNFQNFQQKGRYIQKKQGDSSQGMLAQNFKTLSQQEIKKYGPNVLAVNAVQTQDPGPRIQKFADSSSAAANQVTDYDSSQGGNFFSVKGLQKKKAAVIQGIGQNKSGSAQGQAPNKNAMSNIKQILKIQQQKKEMNLSQSIPLNVSNGLSLNSGGLMGSGAVGVDTQQTRQDEGQGAKQSITEVNSANKIKMGGVVKIKSKSQPRTGGKPVYQNKKVGEPESNNQLLSKDKIKLFQQIQKQKLENSQEDEQNTARHQQAPSLLSQGPAGKSALVKKSVGGPGGPGRIQQNNFMLKKTSAPGYQGAAGPANQGQLHGNQANNPISSARNSAGGNPRYDKLLQQSNQQALQQMMAMSSSAQNTQNASNSGSKLSIKKKIINNIQMQQHSQAKGNLSIQKQQNLKHLQSQMK